VTASIPAPKGCSLKTLRKVMSLIIIWTSLWQLPISGPPSMPLHWLINIRFGIRVLWSYSRSVYSVYLRSVYSVSCYEKSYCTHFHVTNMTSCLFHKCQCTCMASVYVTGSAKRNLIAFFFISDFN